MGRTTHQKDRSFLPPHTFCASMGGGGASEPALETSDVAVVNGPAAGWPPAGDNRESTGWADLPTARI